MDFSDEPSGGQSNATKNPSGPPPPTSPLGVNSQQAPPAIQPPQTNTSWAAAAGKGLPPVEAPAPNGSNASSTNGSSGSSSSKPFEQLNSVREALFSQDGWGGNNVKQVMLTLFYNHYESTVEIWIITNFYLSCIQMSGILMTFRPQCSAKHSWNWAFC